MGNVSPSTSAEDQYEKGCQVARTANTGTRTLETQDVDWEVDAVAWLEDKQRADAAKKDMDKRRTTLMGAITELGDEDDKGHVTLELSHQVGGYVALQRQRRVSVSKDEEVIEEILEAKGLKDRCVKMVPQVDEDAVMACLYEGLLTEEDIYAMFPEKVTFALVAVKP